MTSSERGADEAVWSEFRRQMPVATNWAYFDHAAVAPIPDCGRQAIKQWVDEATAGGEVHWNRWLQAVEDVRSLSAGLLGCHENEVAYIQNTTAGVTLVAEGMAWRDGDNVVIPDAEFPSNAYAWMNLAKRGVDVRRVPAPLGRFQPEDISRACDRRTRLISASWVGYATGWRADLDALVTVARACGAWLFVDAIQGLGVFPLDVRKTPIDFLAADGHKWLLGPEGAGVFYCRREHLDHLRPIGVGWNSVDSTGDFDSRSMRLKPAAARYEGGSYNMAGAAGLAASLRLLTDIGTERLARRILQITSEVCERLVGIGATIASFRDGPHASGIVSFDLPGAPPALVRRQCRERGVVLAQRDGRLRVSPHAYNNQDDVDRLIDAVSRRNSS